MNDPSGQAGFGGGDLSAEQLAYQRGQQDVLRKINTPRMTPFRVICGIVWAVIALGFAAGAIYNINHHSWGDVVVGLIIAGLAAWYDYRIWTLKARRLWLIV